jgi:hypothetical protein
MEDPARPHSKTRGGRWQTIEHQLDFNLDRGKSDASISPIRTSGMATKAVEKSLILQELVGASRTTPDMISPVRCGHVLTERSRENIAWATGLEPAAFCVTNQGNSDLVDGQRQIQVRSCDCSACRPKGAVTFPLSLSTLVHPFQIRHL